MHTHPPPLAADELCWFIQSANPDSVPKSKWRSRMNIAEVGYAGICPLGGLPASLNFHSLTRTSPTAKRQMGLVKYEVLNQGRTIGICAIQKSMVQWSELNS